ncbi:MAG: acetyl-CoA C-acyltransferase [Actinomycetia bacterium]|nr:acetyl-CoA C-acyltransferase [Actinomycetes bacterium]
MKTSSNPVICSVARTPIGRYLGGLSPLRAVDLGARAIAAAVTRSGISSSEVDEVILGHVLVGGEGQITARQAAVKAGLSMTIPALNVNKVCISGLTAVGLASNAIRLGDANFVVAGGMESMSNAPHVLRGFRSGRRMGDGKLVDVMLHDGLFCAFNRSTMGEMSDEVNTRLGVTRPQQDQWSAESHRRATRATQEGHFSREIVPVEVPQRRGDPITIDADEGIRPGISVEKLGGLRRAFTEDGTLTAGNSSQISDGAAALVVASRPAAQAIGATILAEIVAYGQSSGPDATLHERPADAIRMALKRADLSPSDLDMVEINEAFAAVALWSAQMLGLSFDKVNVYGGAVAIGHPIGATGARLVVTLVNALREAGGGLGAAALCGGGGQGDALVIRVL